MEILTRAGRDLPGEREHTVPLASLYMTRHDYDHALDVYKSWGMTNATAGDYRVAAGAAFASHRTIVREKPI